MSIQDDSVAGPDDRAELEISQCARKKSGSVLSSTTTLTWDADSSSDTSCWSSARVSTSTRLIGGWLNLTRHCSGVSRSTINCLSVLVMAFSECRFVVIRRRAARDPRRPLRLLAGLCNRSQRFERGAQFRCEQSGLLPGGEVSAPVDLVEVGEVGIDGLHPAARGSEDLTGKRGEADGDCNRRRSLAYRTQCGLGLGGLPVPPGGRGAGARQPVQRDVVEDVIAREIARGRVVDECAGDLVVAVRVVVEHP